MRRFRAPRAEEIRNLASDYAQLAGAAFTGDVDAPTLQEGGSDLANLYALLTGATFTGDVRVGDSAETSLRELRAQRLVDSLLEVAALGVSGNNGAFLRHLVDGSENGRITTVNGDVFFGVGTVGDRIAEYGSNSNGEYVRLYNGLQVCWHQSVLGGFGSGGGTWSFPASFSGSPWVGGISRRADDVARIISTNGAPWSAGVDLERSGSCQVDAAAIGMWK